MAPMLLSCIIRCRGNLLVAAVRVMLAPSSIQRRQSPQASVVAIMLVPPSIGAGAVSGRQPCSS
eukprot:m.88752 g.88752  ORF g.88752 m.88752 type:complete len:64 (-) comp15201_c5_seq3:310-501(-)